jgi:ribosomal protein L1
MERVRLSRVLVFAEGDKADEARKLAPIMSVWMI